MKQHHPPTPAEKLVVLAKIEALLVEALIHMDTLDEPGTSAAEIDFVLNRLRVEQTRIGEALT